MSTLEETLMKEISKKMFEDMTRVLADYGLEEFELTRIQLTPPDPALGLCIDFRKREDDKVIVKPC